MKKVLMSVAIVSAIAIAAGYSMIGSEKSDVNMSDLTQANVEALAQALPRQCECLPAGVCCDCKLQVEWGKTADRSMQDD